MRVDFDMAAAALRLASPRPDAGAWPGLDEELTALAEGQARVIRHAERRWASVTFSGSRHAVAFVFAGTVAVAAGERFIAALPDHEFAIPGHLVADAAVIAVEHAMLPEPRLTVEAELLLLEEA
jgi:hypothetical protein